MKRSESVMGGRRECARPPGMNMDDDYMLKFARKSREAWIAWINAQGWSYKGNDPNRYTPENWRDFYTHQVEAGVVPDPTAKRAAPAPAPAAPHGAYPPQPGMMHPGMQQQQQHRPPMHPGMQHPSMMHPGMQMGSMHPHAQHMQLPSREAYWAAVQKYEAATPFERNNEDWQAMAARAIASPLAGVARWMEARGGGGLPPSCDVGWLLKHIEEDQAMVLTQQMPKTHEFWQLVGVLRLQLQMAARSWAGEESKRVPHGPLPPAGAPGSPGATHDMRWDCFTRWLLMDVMMKLLDICRQTGLCTPEQGEWFRHNVAGAYEQHLGKRNAAVAATMGVDPGALRNACWNREWLSK